MDKQFTLKLQEWLNTPADKRDLELGATLLLQLTNNKILYRNIKSNLNGHADFIEFKIKRYLQYRLQELTHDEVTAMQKQVEVIARKLALDKEMPQSKSSKTEAQEFRGGKRADHDTLPPEIQALYVENASLMQKMRELHLQLRMLSTQVSACPVLTAIHSSKRLSNWISGITRIGRSTTTIRQHLPMQRIVLRLNSSLSRKPDKNRRISYAR